jgi:acetyl/propionyl-CoA carboxylase alpha subunit
VAKAAGYTNAGTVEFILDESGAFYFLEVNARLQVEHPVTEMITHHDLVRAQVLVAAGERLPFEQPDLVQHGHAMECRVYAEDASRNFLPSTGLLERFVPPSGPSVRVDTGVTQGSEVTVHYDPMLAKLITWGESREESMARARWALDRFVVLGVTTNLDLLQRVIAHPEFRQGRLHTHFLDEHGLAAADALQVPDEALLVAALAAHDPAFIVGRDRNGMGPHEAAPASPWRTGGGWRAL